MGDDLAKLLETAVLSIVDRAVGRAVEVALAKREALREAAGSERLSYTEEEAAGILGIARHVLRDLRRREAKQGRTIGRKLGKQTIYARVELERLLSHPDMPG